MAGIARDPISKKPAFYLKTLQISYPLMNDMPLYTIILKEALSINPYRHIRDTDCENGSLPSPKENFSSRNPILSGPNYK
jgi:hypothetical protein